MSWPAMVHHADLAIKWSTHDATSIEDSIMRGIVMTAIALLIISGIASATEAMSDGFDSKPLSEIERLVNEARERCRAAQTDIQKNAGGNPEAQEAAWLGFFQAQRDAFRALREGLAGGALRIPLPSLRKRLVEEYLHAVEKVPDSVRRGKAVATLIVEVPLNLKALDRQLEHENNSNTRLLPQWVTVDEVARQMPKKSILVDYINPQSLASDASTGGFMAYVLCSAHTDSPVIIPPSRLKSTVAIEDPAANTNNIKDDIQSVRDAIEKAEKIARLPATMGGDVANVQQLSSDFNARMQKLKDDLLVPLDDEFTLVHPGEEVSSGDRWLILSPVADIWLVPFQAMPKRGGGFIIEERKVSYQIAPRELLFRQTRDPRSRSNGLIVYDPDFGPARRPSANSDAIGERSDPTAPPQAGDQFAPRWTYALQQVATIQTVGCWPFRRRVQVLDWMWVPCLTWERVSVNTTFEGATLGGTFRNWSRSGLKKLGALLERCQANRSGGAVYVNALSDANANKNKVRAEINRRTQNRVSSPAILTFVTHGFFDGSIRRGGSSRSPFDFCGLALAGANRIPEDTRDLEDDGILYGSEIVNEYKLAGTDLVVLVACQSGEGQPKSGNSLASLRHAFTLAGARAVVASSWVVMVPQTQDLMEGFFNTLPLSPQKTGTRDIEDALRKTQLSLIEKLRKGHKGAAHPYYWAPFTLTGLW